MSKHLITGLIGTTFINSHSIMVEVGSCWKRPSVEQEIRRFLYYVGVVTPMEYWWVSATQVEIRGTISVEKLMKFGEMYSQNSQYSKLWFPELGEPYVQLEKSDMIDMLYIIFDSKYRPRKVSSVDELTKLIKGHIDSYNPSSTNYVKSKILFELFLDMNENLDILSSDRYINLRPIARKRYAENAENCNLKEVQILNTLVDRYFPK